MVKISSSNDVYKCQVAESEKNWEEGDNWLLGLIAFAVMEEDRIEWSKHFEENNNKAPTPDEVRHWYEQQPNGKLLAARGTASNLLKLYAEDVLEAASEDARREVETGIIVREIQQGRRFGPQVAISVLGGLVAALIFGALITTVYFIAKNDVSPIDATNGIIEQINGGKNNGKTTSKQGSN